MKIIPDEIKAILDEFLEIFDFDGAYNSTKLLQTDQIMQLKSEFEDEKQRLMDEHEKSMGRVKNKIIEVEDKISNLENKQNFAFMRPVMIFQELFSRSISSTWFTNFKLILEEKNILHQILRDSSDSKVKKKMLKWL